MQKFRTEIKWAFIFILSLLVWMALERLVGLHDKHIDKHQYLTMLYAIVAIVIYVLALRDKREKDYNGVMNYKQGLISGLIITVIVAVLSPLTQWIISNVITPHYFDNVIQYSVDSGYIETIEAAKAQFNYKSYAVQSTIGALIMGVVTSAIVAIFTRKKGNPA